MQIISHRGYWKTQTEKNTVAAFERSFEINLGTETDIRDYHGKLVISHDIAGEDSISVSGFLELYKSHNCSGPLALNIKSDGLQLALKDLLEQYSISDYFVFDMSVPDTIGYLKNNMVFFSRESEYEQMPVFYEKCAGIWLDAFEGIWYSSSVIEQHVANGKKVAIVSAELHKRDFREQWNLLKNNHIHTLEGVILCTDIPEEAKIYFNL